MHLLENKEINRILVKIMFMHEQCIPDLAYHPHKLQRPVDKAIIMQANQVFNNENKSNKLSAKMYCNVWINL